MSETTMYDRLRGKEETQTAETETTEQTTEQTIQQKENASTEQQTTNETQTSETQDSGANPYDIESFNKHFQRSFKDEEELKSLFELPDKLKTYEEQVADKERALQELQEKHNSFLDSIDPEKIFTDKEAITLTQLRQKYPNADMNSITNIRSSDLNSMDKLDALVLIDKLTVPSKASDSVRQSEILKGLGIDSEPDDLTENDRYRIEKEYVSKSNVLNEIKDFQPELKKYDFEGERLARQERLTQEKEALKSYNEKALKILLDGFKETKSVFQEDGKDHTYTFTVEEEFKTKNFNDILDAITTSGFKITTENAQEVARQIDNEYWLQNRDKIVRDAVKQEIAKVKEATHKEIHSDSPINKNEAPEGDKGEAKTVLQSIRSGEFKKRMRNY